jgi:nucleotide-binding universal stress UspA family protein
MREDADIKIREMKGKLGIDAPHAVIDATIEEGIQQEAIRRNADLILTGRGLEQGAFSRLWSRLYPIIRESPCPVLSI